MDSLNWPFSWGNRIRYHETMSMLLDYAIRLRAGPGLSFCFGFRFRLHLTIVSHFMYGSPSADPFRIVWWWSGLVWWREAGYLSLPDRQRSSSRLPFSAPRLALPPGCCTKSAVRLHLRPFVVIPNHPFHNRVLGKPPGSSFKSNWPLLQSLQIFNESRSHEGPI
jgi:hypothetical protein